MPTGSDRADSVPDRRVPRIRIQLHFTEVPVQLRSRIRIEKRGDGRFSVTLSPAQASVIDECLRLVVGTGARDDVVRFTLGSSGEEVTAVTEETRRGSQAQHRGAHVLSLGQLHAIYACLTSAVTEFVSDEDFHQRTGWYRENVTALAREMSRSMRDLQVY